MSSWQSPRRSATLNVIIPTSRNCGETWGTHSVSGVPNSALEFQFHVECASDWIIAIGSNFTKAEAAVHGDGILHHGLDGVETHARVAHGTGFAHDASGECAAQ